MDKEKNFLLSIAIGVVDRASAELQKFDQSLKATGTSLTSIGVSAAAAGAAIVASLKYSVDQAAAFETVYKQLENTVDAVGGNFDQSRTSINAYIDTMKSMTTLTDDRVVTALKSMLVFTKDTSRAMEGVSLAADIAASGMMGMEQTTRVVGMAMNGNIQMLGRLLPEFRGLNTVLFDGMTSAEKADFAMRSLKETFGGMAASELETFNGQMTQLKKYIGEIWQAVGNNLLPSLTEMVSRWADSAKNLLSFVESNRALILSLTETVGQLGILLGVIGSAILTVPKLMQVFQGLWAVVSAHPFIALTAAIAGATIALANYANRLQEERNATINTGKTLQDKIKLMDEAKRKYQEMATDASLSAEQQTQAVNNYMSALKAQKLLEQQISKETSDAINSQRAMEAEEDYARMLEENRLKLQEQDLYWSVMKEQQDRADAYKRQKLEEMKFTFTGAWRLMFSEAMVYQTNFYQQFTSMMASLQTSVSSSFAYMMNNIGGGWNTLTDGMKRIGEGLKQAIINVIANIAAEWVVKHAMMSAATLAWKAIEIAAKAAVAAATAAAATAWTLWGAIAIGASIGLAVMAYNNQFARGVDNFAGGVALVGERGPELVNLPAGSSVYTADKTAAMLSGGGGTTIVLNITGNEIMGDSAIDDFSERITESIMRQIKFERNL